MAYRGHGKQDLCLFVPFVHHLGDALQTLQNLGDGQQFLHELLLRYFMAVGDHGTFFNVFIDPRRTQRQNDMGTFGNLLTGLFKPIVEVLEQPFLGSIAQKGMGIKAMPAFVKEEQLLFGISLVFKSPGDQVRNSDRVEQDTERIGQGPELEMIEFLPNMFRKARAQKQQATVITDLFFCLLQSNLGL